MTHTLHKIKNQKGQRTMKNANEQHPNWKPPEDFNFEKLEEIGFDDISWHNDAFPFFGDWKRGYTLGVDHV